MMTSATLARSFEESVLAFIRRQVRADLVVASTAATGWIEAPLDESLGGPPARDPGRHARRAGAPRRARLPRRAHQHRLARRERVRVRARAGLRLLSGRAGGRARRRPRRDGGARLPNFARQFPRGRRHDARARHARGAVRRARGAASGRLRFAPRKRQYRRARHTSAGGTTGPSSRFHGDARVGDPGRCGPHRRCRDVGAEQGRRAGPCSRSASSTNTTRDAVRPRLPPDAGPRDPSPGRPPASGSRSAARRSRSTGAGSSRSSARQARRARRWPVP